MAEVRLVDLDVIKRYSLAIRQESADADDVLAALEADVATLRRVTGRTGAESRSATPRPSPGGPTAKKPAKKPAKSAKTPAKKVSKKAAAPEPETRRSSANASERQGATAPSSPAAKSSPKPTVYVPAVKKVVQPTPKRAASPR